MQERVMPSGDGTTQVVVQHSPDLMSVGIGLEIGSVMPNAHFLDALYGDQIEKIGEIFAKERMKELQLMPLVFDDSDDQKEWYEALGRAMLDAVGGSSVNDGLWTWLDRPGTNRLVRLIRKARDNAFGRDE